MAVTTAIIGAVTAAAGAAMGVVSSIEQSNTQRAQAEYQSDMADYNAKVAEGQAQIVEDDGKQIKQDAYEDATRKRQETALLVSSQRALQGASGAQVDVGSNLDLNLDTAEKGELEALQIQEQGERAARDKKLEAWSNRNQGSKYETQSEFYTNQANARSPLADSQESILSGFKQTSNAFINLM